MGIFRSYFRPDKTPEDCYCWQGGSVGNQEMRKTHNRRQRAYNKALIEGRQWEDDYEAEDAEDAQPHRGGVAVSPSETPDGSR